MAEGKRSFDIAKAIRILKRIGWSLFIGLFLLYWRKNPPLNALIFAFLTTWAVWSLVWVTATAALAIRKARMDSRNES